jgi:hypothetical protein
MLVSRFIYSYAECHYAECRGAIKTATGKHTNQGILTVPLTSCLTGLETAV